MKKNNDHEEQEWFTKHVADELQKLDAMNPSDIPSVVELASLVESHRIEYKRKQWRELLLFWIIAVPILAIMLGILIFDWMWFAAIQMLVSIVAISFIFTKMSRRENQQWNNG